MPTPSVGSISVSNLEAEFAKVDGRPSGIGEYTGRAGSFSGTSLGIEGTSTVGPIAFSDLRGRTAHANPEKIINTLFDSFGTSARKYYAQLPALSFIQDHIYGNTVFTGTTQPYESDTFGYTGPQAIIEYGGNLHRGFPFAYVNTTTDGNIPASHVSPKVSFNTVGFDEDVLACRDNTVVYLATGKCKTIGQYGTGTNGNTPVSPTLRINDFKFNDSQITPQDLSVALTWGVDHGAGNRGAKYNSFNTTAKTCMAVYTTPNALSLAQCLSAQFTAGGAFWNGNYGSKDSDSLYQKFMLLLPNRWERVSSTLYSVGSGVMTLQPNDIAVVTNAGPGSETTTLGYKRYWYLRSEYNRRSRTQVALPLPSGAIEIPKQDVLSLYGNRLTIDKLPTKFPKNTPLQTAINETFDAYRYIQVPVNGNAGSPVKMKYAPITNWSFDAFGNTRRLPAMFFSATAMFGKTCIGVYANYFTQTVICDLATPNFAPYVSIFRFVGDGYMTSRGGQT
jgi:hypothetical protein